MEAKENKDLGIIDRILGKIDEIFSRLEIFGPNIEAEFVGEMSETYTNYAFHHADHLGSASVTTNENGEIISDIRYYPYGDTRYEDASYEVKYKYNDKELDTETDLYYYGARYYDSAVGRWVSNDPLQRNIGAMVSLGELNGYRYVLNNPMKYVDPTGAYTELIIKHGNVNNSQDNGHAILRINDSYIDFSTWHNRQPDESSWFWGKGEVNIWSLQKHLNFYHKIEPSGATFSMYELNLTKEQEMAILNYAKQLASGEADVSRFNILWNNCTDFIIEEFLEKFTDFNFSMWIDEVDEPEELGDEVYEMYKNGDEKINNVYGGYERDGMGYKVNTNPENHNNAGSFRKGVQKERDKGYKDLHYHQA